MHVVNTLNIPHHLLEDLELDLDKFLKQYDNDPTFYCNPQIKYCKDRGIPVRRVTGYDEQTKVYEITYEFSMTDKELVLFLITFPDDINRKK